MFGQRPGFEHEGLMDGLFFYVDQNFLDVFVYHLGHSVFAYGGHELNTHGGKSK